ncbi:MAG: bifunctional nuclease family protein [Elusimicrobia bacterium]|nr:bifunctional nuclease family protein [Elusimicrobiota bacterium]
MSKDKNPPDKNPPDKTPPEEGTPEKEVRIYSLATTANECIIFLEELGGNRLLPIWIGIAEGQAIAIRFSGIVLPRPLTHDLLLATVTAVGFTVHKVVVHDIRENTFYARVLIKKGAQSLAVDSRPSDAIAVAVRAGCPIFVEEKVFDRCQTLTKPITEDEVKRFKSELKTLKPEDIFGDLKKKKEEGPESRKEDEKDEEADS